MNHETDTPRTDAAKSYWDGTERENCVSIAFARGLERELLTARNDAFNLANALSEAEAEVQRIYAGIQGNCYCCELVGILNQKLEAEIKRIKALPHFHHESYCRKCNEPK